MKKHPFRSLIISAIIAIIPLALLACGSGSSSPSTSSVDPARADPVSKSATVVEDSVTESKTETAKDSPAHDEAADVAKTHSEMTKESESDTETAMAADSGEASESAPAPLVETEAEIEAPALLTAYNDFGFSLKLDRGASVESYGWTEGEPSLDQGLISFAYGGVNTNMVWSPPEDRDPLILLADTYNLLRASQPDTSFDPISDGEVTVNGQEGVYGGFKASGVNGESLGGGLIGTWLCPENETAYRLTLTGDDATLVQLRFDRLLENFSCGSAS